MSALGPGSAQHHVCGVLTACSSLFFLVLPCLHCLWSVAINVCILLMVGTWATLAWVVMNVPGNGDAGSQGPVCSSHLCAGIYYVLVPGHNWLPCPGSP